MAGWCFLLWQDCCSELEAKGAGADHAYTMEAKAEQVMCDVPRTMYIIGGHEFGAATGEQAVANVEEKKVRVVLWGCLAHSNLTLFYPMTLCHSPLTLPFTTDHSSLSLSPGCRAGPAGVFARGC